MDKYWVERMAHSQDILMNKSEKEIAGQLVKYYKNSMKRIIGQFEATVNELNSSIAEGEKPQVSDLYRLKRYWELQQQLDEELTSLGIHIDKSLNKGLFKHYMEAYENIQLKDMQAYSTLSKDNVKQLLKTIWVADGKSFSDRVWGNTAKLKEVLNQELVHCVAAGEKPSKLIKRLKDDFGVSFNQASTISRTEIAHIQTEAANQRYKDYGIKEVEVIVESNACPHCQELKGKRYPVGSPMPVPLHPNCRCCVVPVIE